MELQLSLLQSKVIETETEKRKITEETVTLKQQQSKSVENSKSNIAELQILIDELKEENNQLKRSNQQKQGDMERLTKESVLLENKLKQLKTEKEKLEEKLIEAENFLDSKQGKANDRLEKQLAQARVKYAQAISDLDDMESELEDVREQLAEERSKNQRLRGINPRILQENKSNKKSTETTNPNKRINNEKN